MTKKSARKKATIVVDRQISFHGGPGNLNSFQEKPEDIARGRKIKSVLDSLPLEKIGGGSPAFVIPQTPLIKADEYRGHTTEYGAHRKRIRKKKQ